MEVICTFEGWQVVTNYRRPIEDGLINLLETIFAWEKRKEKKRNIVYTKRSRGGETCRDMTVCFGKIQIVAPM